MTLNEVLSHFHRVRYEQHGYKALCPAHPDKNPSLSISEGRDGKIMLHCYAGCTAEEVVTAAGLTMNDLFPDDISQNSRAVKPKKTISAEYIYRDGKGRAILKKIRYSDKSFTWQRYTGSEWEYGRAHLTAPLYRQSVTEKNSSVFIIEGEKDADNLYKARIPAVSPPDGAKTKWQPAYTKALTGKDVFIIPDNDEPGWTLARNICTELQGKAKSVKILDLKKIWADIPAKGDISDMMQAVPDWKQRLLDFAKNEPPYDPEAEDAGIIRLSDVQISKTEWLWYPYIPQGKITLLTADPGTGKTFFSLYLAAQISTGRPFFGEECGYKEPRCVIYQTAEDGISDTIKPRLESMQPNFRNILCIDEHVETLKLSDERIERYMKKHRPALMIFDPLQAYLGADVDMHRANEVRPILSRIGRLAEQYGCAVLFIMHNSKLSGASALYRSLGSIDIPAVARSMLIMGKNPNDPTQKIICHEKSSLAVHGKSLLFRIEPQFGGVTFCGYSDLKADDVLNPNKGGRDKPAVKLEDAVSLLNELIGERGWADCKKIYELQERADISKSTLYNAKDVLQLESVSTGFGRQRKTYWVRPDFNKEQFLNERLKESDVISDIS